MKKRITDWLTLITISILSISLIIHTSSAVVASTTRLSSSGSIQYPAEDPTEKQNILSIAYGFSSGFTASQIDFALSNYDVIVMHWYDYANVKNSIVELKQERPDLKIVVYISAISASPTITEYMDWDEVEIHDDWFLYDVDGNRLQISWSSGWYLMDMSHPGWQDYLGDWCNEVLTECPEIDGIFVDNAWVGLYQNDFTVPSEKIPTEYKLTWNDNIRGFLQYIKNRIGYKLLIANTGDGVDFNYLSVCDGMMAEGFVHVPWWSADYFGTFDYSERLANYKNVLDNGKRLLAIDGCSGTPTDRVFYYSFCSFLLVADDYASYMFRTWWNVFQEEYFLALTDGAELLGSASSDYYALGDCLVRDFENGMVIVNYNSHSTTVNLGTNYQTLDGTILDQITLSDHTGVILYTT